MLSSVRNWALLALVLVLLPLSAKATDLTCYITSPADDTVLPLYEDVTVKVRVNNINILTAAAYTVSIKIESFEDGVIYSDMQFGTNLAPGGEKIFEFGAGFPEFEDEYRISAHVTFSEDIDNSNNDDDIFFDVKQDNSLGALFIEAALGIGGERLDQQNGLYFGASIAFPPGTHFTSYDKTEFDFTATKYTYFGWLDNAKYERFTHPSWVYTQEYNAPETFKWYKINYWPQINGLDFPQDSDRAKYLMRGTDITFAKGDTASISTGTTPGPKDDSVCAILVCGEWANEFQRKSFTEDLTLMENNLRLELMGPRIPADHVTKLVNPSRQQVLDAIAMMQGKCKKLIFYYTGHGSEGMMSTREASLFYFDLFSGLYATGASELTVMIDACHSGSAIEDAKLQVAYDNHNITILTSSSKDSSSWIDGVELSSGMQWAAGLYTYAWAQGFGNPLADYDHDGKVTEVEAHNYAMFLNPIKFGKPMDSLMRPQILIHRAVQPLTVDQPVVVPDADLTITPKVSIGIDTKLTLGLNYSYDGSYNYAPVDTTTLYISPVRKWDIKLNGQLNYSFDLKFNYQTGYDTLPPIKTGYTPGVVTYDSARATWTAHYPSLWDEAQKSITALGVKHFSPWAIAMVKVQSSEGVSDDILSSLNLSLYPNPFKDMFAVEIHADKAMQASISVTDITGKTMMPATEVQLNEGKYTLQLDGSLYPAGAYYLVLQTQEGSKRTLVVRK